MVQGVIWKQGFRSGHDSEDRYVGADRKLTRRGCSVKLGLVYAANPRLSRYSIGLSEPKDILIRIALYQ